MPQTMGFKMHKDDDDHVLWCELRLAGTCAPPTTPSNRASTHGALLHSRIHCRSATHVWQNVPSSIMC